MTDIVEWLPYNRKVVTTRDPLIPGVVAALRENLSDLKTIKRVIVCEPIHVMGLTPSIDPIQKMYKSLHEKTPSLLITIPRDFRSGFGGDAWTPCFMEYLRPARTQEAYSLGIDSLALWENVVMVNLLDGGWDTPEALGLVEEVENFWYRGPAFREDRRRLFWYQFRGMSMFTMWGENICPLVNSPDLGKAVSYATWAHRPEREKVCKKFGLLLEKAGMSVDHHGKGALLLPIKSCNLKETLMENWAYSVITFPTWAYLIGHLPARTIESVYWGLRPLVLGYKGNYEILEKVLGPGDYSQFMITTWNWDWKSYGKWFDEEGRTILIEKTLKLREKLLKKLISLIQAFDKNFWSLHEIQTEFLKSVLQDKSNFVRWREWIDKQYMGRI